MNPYESPTIGPTRPQDFGYPNFSPLVKTYYTLFIVCFLVLSVSFYKDFNWGDTILLSLCLISSWFGAQGCHREYLRIEEIVRKLELDRTGDVS